MHVVMWFVRMTERRVRKVDVVQLSAGADTGFCVRGGI